MRVKKNDIFGSTGFDVTATKRKVTSCMCSVRFVTAWFFFSLLFFRFHVRKADSELVFAFDASVTSRIFASRLR